MTTLEILEIYKTRKDDLIEKTIELMPQALSGDRANRTFFFKVDEATNELTVDYDYYLGQQQLGVNCFYTVEDHDTPDPEDYGYNSIEQMDFYVCGYAEQIEYYIDQLIMLLEKFEA